MNRPLYALLTAAGVVKLGAPIWIVVVALAHRAPHVLVAPRHPTRGVAPIEAVEALVVRGAELPPVAAANPVYVANNSAGVDTVVSTAPRPFDLVQAKSTVMRSMESLPICRREDASGPGVAEITWASDGRVARVALSSPYVESTARGCIARRFEQATVASYDGPPQVMRVRFSL